MPPVLVTRGVDPNVITYNSVISAYAKEGNWQGANDVLRRMLQNQNVEPNVTTYNAVINAYANKGHWQGAEDVLHRMNAHNIQPNMTTYNSLIDAYANKGTHLDMTTPPGLLALHFYASQDTHGRGTCISFAQAIGRARKTCFGA